MNESDWKKFSGMVPFWRERYLAEQNARIARLLAEPNKTETERFWDSLDEMKKEAKILRQCLDGHSRSNMLMAMLSMRGVGMLKKEDLADFSPELQKMMFPDAFEDKG